MSSAPRDSGSDPEEKWLRALVEAQDLCARLDAEAAAARDEAERARCRSKDLEDSVAYRLGSLLLDTVRSWRGVIALPGAVTSLVRHWRARGTPGRGEPAVVASPSNPPPGSLPGADIVAEWHRSRRPASPSTLGEFRVAAVVDPFTRASFAPDCRLLNLRIADVEQQIDQFQPHVLFVESAWRGEAGDWTRKLAPCSGDLRRLVDVCRRRAIPTVFWCKEDPVHFDEFIAAAALFDHVFTTDADCVERYRAKLGHERVGVLGFACQPAIHNPLEHERRRCAASFAGSWYAKYPERARDFEALVDSIQQVLPVEIHDRNHDRGDPAFAYPAKYRPLIKGGVPYERISEVYKACDFGITVNTITSSPTMFARRTHELLACNTITISNHCEGVDRAYGDLVVMAERDDLPKRLADLRDSEDARHRLRLRGLREVMTHHTAAARLAEIAAVSVGPILIAEPTVWVVASVESEAELIGVLDMFRLQRWERRRLLLLVSADLETPDELPEQVRVIAGDATATLIADCIPEEDWVASWCAADYYGPRYLFDLVQATDYTDARAVGKSTCFEMSGEALSLQRGQRPYTYGVRLLPRASIFKASLCAGSLRELVSGLGEPSARLQLKGLAVDEFGYCRHGAGHAAVRAVNVD